MKAKITAHKEALQAKALFLLRVEPHSITFTRYKKCFQFENIYIMHPPGSLRGFITQ